MIKKKLPPVPIQENIVNDGMASSVFARFLNALRDSLSLKIDDAPHDGNRYVRKNNKWEVL